MKPQQRAARSLALLVPAQDAHGAPRTACRKRQFPHNTAANPPGLRDSERSAGGTRPHARPKLGDHVNV